MSKLTILFVLGALLIAPGASLADDKPGTAAEKAPEATAGERDRSFEHAVRGLMFRGFSGDSGSLKRAMEMCDERLAELPGDPEALVWWGAGRYYQAGQKFQTGDYQTGMAWRQESLDAMDKAVTAAPRDVAVLIPRGATLIVGSRHEVMPAERKRFLQLARSDYETTMDVQSRYFSKLSDHARGELMLGLVEVYHGLEDTAARDAMLDRIATTLGDTPYGAEVQRARESGLEGLTTRTCGGCH